MKPIIAVLLAVLFASCVVLTNASHSQKQLVNSIKHLRREQKKLLDLLSDMQSAQENDDWCPETGTRSDASVDAMIAKMASVQCLDEKLRIVQNFLKETPESLTGAQVNKIVPIFNEFVFVQIAVVRMIQPYILGMRAADLVKLLSSVKSTTDRINLLESMKNVVFEVQANKNVIIEAFEPADRQEVENVLSNAKGTNCVFGRVDQPSTVFVVDVSPSMDEQFQHPSGKTYTRLDFVKIQLEQLLRSLDSTQTFNVVAFSRGAKPLRPDLIAATPENVEAMIKDVKAMTTSSYTNIEVGIVAAFKMNPSAIYVLSDGAPNEGATRPGQFDHLIQSWNSLRAGKGLRPATINTISFLLGVPKLYPTRNWEGDKREAAAILKTIDRKSVV